MENIIRNNFRKLRQKANITQTQMAEYLNLEKRIISKFERGEGNLGVGSLEKACLLFGVSIKDIQEKNMDSKTLSPSIRKASHNVSSFEDISNINRIAMNIIEMREILDNNKK